MADNDFVTRKELETYKSQVQDTVHSLAGALEKLKKEIGGLRAQIGTARAK
jgi:hypothetical protein